MSLPKHSSNNLIFMKLARKGSIFSISWLVTFIVAAPYTLAAPCYPNDPEDSNPGNLCLTYPPSFDPQSTNWSPLPNSSTNQPPFIQGTGSDAYYGFPVSTTQPGRIIGKTSGYWTNVEAANGTTTITDSTGNIIIAP